MTSEADSDNAFVRGMEAGVTLIVDLLADGEYSPQQVIDALSGELVRPADGDPEGDLADTFARQVRAMVAERADAG